MDLTPRLRFQENKEYTTFHKELVVSDRFRAAAEASLLQTILAQPETDDPVVSAANWHRLEGARAFLKTLLNVAESSRTLPDKPPQNLTR
jgi:hypothetical protein